jgi:hypothetical protein
MSTLFEKFPNVPEVINKVKVYPVGITFTPVLNAGVYEFNSTTIPAFEGNSGEMFILDGVYLSATGGIDELTFSKAVQGFLSLDIVRDGNKHPVTLAPFKFASFSQAQQFSANFAANATENNQELFNFVLNGKLDQIAELVGSNLKVNLICNIYRVKMDLKS